MGNVEFKISDLKNADSEELESLATHYQLCWKETYSGILPVPAIEELVSQANSKEINGWLTGDGERKITLAHSKVRIVGAVASNCIESRCYLWGMYVPELFQRKGVGGLLLQGCVERAKMNSCSALELLVLESSVKAVDFYLGNGFNKLEKTAYEIVTGIELVSWRLERIVE